MKRKTFTPEQIIGKLRVAEVLLSQGQTVDPFSAPLAAWFTAKASKLPPTLSVAFKNQDNGS